MKSPANGSPSSSSPASSAKTPRILKLSYGLACAGRRMNNRTSRRQHLVAPYVLDFYCADLKLAIELDGGQLNTTEGMQHDKAREAF